MSQALAKKVIELYDKKQNQRRALRIYLSLEHVKNNTKYHSDVITFEIHYLLLQKSKFMSK